MVLGADSAQCCQLLPRPEQEGGGHQASEHFHQRGWVGQGGLHLLMAS